jgi:hypothetical protein
MRTKRGKKEIIIIIIIIKNVGSSRFWIHDHLINVGFMMETYELLLQKDMTIMQ